MDITATRTIKAPIDVVFGVFADIENADRHIEGITSVEIISDVRLGLGTRWRETRLMFGKAATEEMEITEFTPPTGYAVGSDSRGTRYRTTYDFVDRDGATEVTMVFSGTPMSLGAKLLSPLGFLFAGQLRKMLEADLDDLAAVCQAESGP